LNFGQTFGGKSCQPLPVIKNVSRIRKKTFYSLFCMGTREGHQKSIFNSPIVKKNKDTYGIYPTKFVSSIQKHKKVIVTPNQPIQIKKISNKSMFSTSKVCCSQNTEKKLCSLRLKCKGAKNSYGGYPTKFAGSTQNPKKCSEHQIYQSEENMPKKSMFSTLKV
jgi:hypothetical protein